MGTAFTYQGRLTDANQPANGLYDFQFKLFDAPTAGNQRGPTESFFDIFLDAGYFTVELDFVGDDPNVSTLGLIYKRIWGSGEARWLEIAVRPVLQLAESDQTYSLTAEPQPEPLVYTILSPRQKITPVPYALYSLSSGEGPEPEPLGVGGSGTDNYIPRWRGTSDLENSVIYQTDTGNVGIGTTGPASTLEVSDAGGSTLILRDKGSMGGDGAGIDFRYGGAPPAYIARILPYVQGGGGGDILFQTAPDYDGPYETKMILQRGGNVGIGTTSPTAKLQVAGTTLISNGGIETIFGTAATPGYRFMGTGVNMGMFAASANELAFSTNSAERMRINSAGNVGIGTTAPTEKLDVNGTARLRGISAGGTGTVPVVVDGNGKLWKSGLSPSSRRYKTNIQDLESDTSKVLELRPVRFQWKTTGQEEIGLIAEEVEVIAKDLVIYDQEGKPDAVKYDKVALYLLSVVKAQQQRIAALEAKQAENRSLAQRIEALEQMLRQQNFPAKEVQ